MDQCAPKSATREIACFGILCENPNHWQFTHDCEFNFIIYKFIPVVGVKLGLYTSTNYSIWVSFKEGGHAYLLGSYSADIGKRESTYQVRNMEVIESSTEALSNRQVLDLLKDYTSKKQTNLATILYETTSYLESSPAATSSLTNIATFLDILNAKKYDLTKMEKIQIVNLKPQNETELHLIIDNIEEKLTDEQRGEILGLIKVNLDQPSEGIKCEHDTKRVKH